jgi:hypothetical protein
LIPFDPPGTTTGDALDAGFFDIDGDDSDDSDDDLEDDDDDKNREKVKSKPAITMSRRYLGRKLKAAMVV